jgi:hypothetical protein
VFKDTEDGQLLKTTMEFEDDKSIRTWQKDGRQSEDKRKLQIAKEGIEKRHEDSLMSGSNKGIYTVQTLEVMGLSLQILFSDYEPILIVNGKEIVLKGHKGALMERTLSKGCIMEEGRAYIHKENSVQGGTTSPVKTMKWKGKEDSQEPKDKLEEADVQQKIEDKFICTNCKKRNGRCDQQTEKRQEISEDEGKDAIVNLYASAVRRKGVRWNVMFMVVTIIFIVVKGTL